MDNLEQLGSMLTPLLSDPDTMNSLRQAAEQMGLGGLLPDSEEGAEKTEQPETPADDVSGKKASFPGGALSPEMLSTLSKVMPLLSSKGDDDAVRLLSALRPFLSTHRARRLDEAERLLSLTRVLSILKESKLM